MSEVNRKCYLSQIYTNHSIRVIGCTVHTPCKFSNSEIMSVSSHKSLQACSPLLSIRKKRKRWKGQSIIPVHVKEGGWHRCHQFSKRNGSCKKKTSKIPYNCIPNPRCVVLWYGHQKLKCNNTDISSRKQREFTSKFGSIWTQFWSGWYLWSRHVKCNLWS